MNEEPPKYKTEMKCKNCAFDMNGVCVLRRFAIYDEEQSCVKFVELKQ